MADLLGPFEQAVLLAVVRLREDAYGRAILKHVQERLGREVAAGAAHATLSRIEKQGLVTSWLGSGTPIRGGRQRRYYRATPAGIRALNDSHAAVRDLWRGLKWPLEGYT
jgi:DNA-binding PadR family transcriptional regulator